MSGKFRPSIINYSSFKDIEMVIDELVEEINEKLAKCRLDRSYALQDGDRDTADDIYIEINTLHEMNTMLLMKKIEVFNRYEDKK